MPMQNGDRGGFMHLVAAHLMLHARSDIIRNILAG